VFNRKYLADSFFIPLAFAGVVTYSASLGAPATHGVMLNAHLF
jgi:hypothetical protein